MNRNGATPTQNLHHLSFDEFDNILESAQEKARKRLTDIARLVDSNSIYLFGFGGKGRALAHHIAKNQNYELSVYDSHSETREIASKEGFRVIDNISSIDITKSCVILGACQAQAEQALIIKNNYIYFQEAAYFFDAPHLANSPRNFSTYILENKDALYRIYNRIHPDSRGVFFAILRFRISLDPVDLSLYKKNNSDMWFDVIESKSNRKYSTFLDLGAYDGDTLQLARDRLSITRGIAVEANNEMFESITKASANIPNGILILPHAAWSHDCHLSFSEVRNGMIQVTESSDGEMAAAPIDNHVDESVDLIKMDIEGAEIRALSGCRKLLAKYSPDLAIAAYHRPDDFVSIIDFLDKESLSTTPYQIHVGHYSDCIDDSILYFLHNS